MFSGIWTALVNVVLGLFGLRRAGPKIEDIAASNATAQVELAQERTAHAIVATAAAARADASDGVVRVVTEAKPGGSVADTLAKRFPDDFRD